MKNQIKFILFFTITAVIVFLITTCNSSDESYSIVENTNGNLIINGLEAHNTKFIYATGYKYPVSLVAFSNIPTGTHNDG